MIGSGTYKNLNYECVSGSKNRKVQGQIRLKTDLLGDKNVSKNQVFNKTSYGRIREERLQMFLNETLSIIKVNNHEMLLKSSG